MGLHSEQTDYLNRGLEQCMDQVHQYLARGEHIGGYFLCSPTLNWSIFRPEHSDTTEFPLCKPPKAQDLIVHPLSIVLDNEQVNPIVVSIVQTLLLFFFYCSLIVPIRTMLLHYSHSIVCNYLSSIIVLPFHYSFSIVLFTIVLNSI